MDKNESKQERMGISDMIRGGLEESWRSISKIEAEGEKLVRGLVDLAERHGLEAGTKAVEDLGRDARRFLDQLNQTIEDSTKRAFERLNVPTREDLDMYNRRVKALIDENVTSRMEKLKVPTGKDFDAMARQLRGNLEEQVRKGLGRLNPATRREVETVGKDLKKLQKDMAKLVKASAPKKTKATHKKAAPKKTTAARKKPAPKKATAARKKVAKK